MRQQQTTEAKTMGITVHLRERKQTSKGKISLYLEYYKGTTKTPEGKIKPIRDYEYLNLYLVDKPKTPTDKDQNRKTLELAKVIKAKRELELKNGQHGFSSGAKDKATLLDYMKAEAEKRSQSKSSFRIWLSALKHLTDYIQANYGSALTLYHIDEKFCEGFKSYLSDSARKSTGQALLSSTQNSYYVKFTACLAKAVKDRVIQRNPSQGIMPPRSIYKNREYLTIEELKRLAKTECKIEELKKAFLFSCLTGLRWSDIEKLTWREVQQFGNGWRLVFHQQKTKGLQYLDISNEARSLLREQSIPEDRVFNDLKYSSHMVTVLTIWVLKAGITKNITFHCARHTYAVLQLNYGTDIFTLSKMLGHAAISTTMVYSQIMDQKRIEAANRIPSINL